MSDPFVLTSDVSGNASVTAKKSSSFFSWGAGASVPESI
jgi:hypothetical protein